MLARLIPDAAQLGQWRMVNSLCYRKRRYYSALQLPQNPPPHFEKKFEEILSGKRLNLKNIHMYVQ